MKLYYHKTGGGAEYLTDKFIVCPNGGKEGTIEGAEYIVRIDGDKTKDCELTVTSNNELLNACKRAKADLRIMADSKFMCDTLRIGAKTSLEMATKAIAKVEDALKRGVDLSGAGLRGANLTCADLRGANLRGANLTCADLSDADLSGGSNSRHYIIVEIRGGVCQGVYSSMENYTYDILDHDNEIENEEDQKRYDDLCKEIKTLY